MFRHFVPLIVISLIASPASAEDRQQPSPLINALAACRTISDGAARLACYDRASDALTGAAARGDIAVVDREQVRNVRRSLFGFAIPKFPFFSGRKDAKEEEEQKEITSTVQAFRSIGNNRYRVVIADNNAIWETTESMALRDAKTGEKVTITAGSIGSYFMQIGKQRWVRARRVR